MSFCYESGGANATLQVSDRIFQTLYYPSDDFCKRSIDVWLAPSEIKALTIEAITILQGFPSWYCLPEKVSVAGSILGYSVPPPLIKALVGT
jgi:hypothetical protein